MNGILKINGGNKLNGEITPVSNKNAVVSVLPLCLLTNEDCIYNNLPNTTDVQKIIGMLKKLGAEVDDSNFSRVKINCKNVNSYEVDFELGSTIRASLNFAGPLLARFGKAKIPLPGGCTLGIRSINTHLDSFYKAGVKFTIDDKYVYFENAKVTSNLIWQSEASVTGTENIISFLAGIPNETHVVEAATEPHVTQVEKALEQMGANIKVLDAQKIIINGPINFKGGEVTPPDIIEANKAVFLAALADKTTTIMHNANFLKRRYATIVEDYKKLGADIEVLE